MFKPFIVALTAILLFISNATIASADTINVPGPVGEGISCARAVRAAAFAANDNKSPYDSKVEVLSYKEVGRMAQGFSVNVVSFVPAKMLALQEARCYIKMIEAGVEQGWYQHSQPYLHMGDARTDYQILLDFESWMLAELSAVDDGWYEVHFLNNGQVFRKASVQVGGDEERQMRAAGWLP